MHPDDLPADVAFTTFLASVEVARFSDLEWRLFQWHRLHRNPTNFETEKP